MDGLTTAYQDDLRAPLGRSGGSGSPAIDLEDYFDDDSTSDIAEHDCDQDACSYCNDPEDASLRVEAMYVFERMTDMLRADGVDFEELTLLEELRGNIKRNGGR